MTRSASASNGPGVVRSLTPFLDPLPIPPRRVIAEPTRLTVRLQTAMHQYHSGLPPSRVWTYDGHLPGPTIEVRRGVPVEVQWDNRLEGTLPVTVVRAPRFEVDGLPVQCAPGRSGGVPDADAVALPGFSVTAPARRSHPCDERWLDGEPRAPRSVDTRHLPERPACRDALVPRPRHGRDPVQRVCRPRRVVDRARRAGARAGSARRPTPRGAVAACRPELRCRLRRSPDRRAAAQDRP